MLDSNKARLVAKDFNHQEDIDYNERFNSVVKPTTIRIVLAIVVSNDWVTRQLDVSNEFLCGTLSENVYSLWGS